MLSTLVTPPPTVASIKRCLAKLEIIDHSVRSSLFLTPSSQAPMMDDTRKVDILRPGGPGSISREPLALLVDLSSCERRSVDELGGDSTEGGKPSESNADIRDPRYSTLSIL